MCVCVILIMTDMFTELQICAYARPVLCLCVLYMGECVCMCVCVCVCIHVICVYVCLFVCVYVLYL